MKHVTKKPIKQERWQTKISGGNFADKFHAYRNLHAHALFSSLGRLVASRFSSAMTIVVLAIAISLASGFYILVANLQQLAGNLEASNQISLFIKDEISDARLNKFAESIRRNPDIQEVKLITKEQALAEFQAYSGFGDAVKALEKNPLPVVIQVLPRNSLENEQALTDLLDDFERSAEVDFAQMDMQWVKRLQSIMEVARRGVILLSLLLGAGVLFITANTIRLELYKRRDEVVIAKLVGATNSFICRPFLYSGFWIGFFSGVTAWFIITTIMLILKQPVETLSRLYDDAFHVLFLGFTETLALLLISSVLGVVGSWIVLHFQLRQLKPE
ncbi:permease-like cell division protein FtsX [Methylobacter svalbardensis]|uniref:permease-like cell division protein FtsX n=1 Tax=Methylobacter svalbardensis TaxID=3080016 RepID=UPI0030EBBF79